MRIEPAKGRIPRGSQPDVDIAPELSVVLPCYRAAAIARKSVDRLAVAFDGRISRYEIIVVEDGGDECQSSLEDVVPGPGGTVRLISLPTNRGKGAAVAAGMRSARGDVRVFTDIDVPYGTTPIMLMETLIRTRGFHMVIGDRTFRQSRYETEIPVGRRIASAVFSRVTAALVTGGFFDTQCGLKAFRGDVAQQLFKLQTLDRFAFDVELIYLALTYGLEIKRIPVRLETNAGSSVRLGRDSMRTLMDLVRIKYHQMSGDYASESLATLVATECADAALPLRTPVTGRPALKVHA